MVFIKPFAALRPVPALAQDVASPPYDVMDENEAREMAANKPNHFIHVLRSEIDLPDNTDPYAPEVYQQAKSFLEQLIANGVMIQEAKSCFYLYRQKMDARTQIGIVGCASVDEYQQNIVKKHELTRKDKQADRTRHIEITNAQTGPIFLAYHQRAELHRMALRIMQSEPLCSFTKNKQVIPVEHTVWRIDSDADISLIVSELAKEKYAYIADGHHRCASAAAVRDQRKAAALAAGRQWTGKEECNFTMSVFFPAEQLYIMDYNRIVHDLNGLSKDEFLSRVSEKFELTSLTTADHYPQQMRQISMYLDRKWYTLTIKPGTFDEQDSIASLDVSVLQNNLLDPILGIKDPTTDKRISFVGGIRGLEELERQANACGGVSFAMYPTQIEQLIQVADDNKQMPPKSTWFEPKLLSGLFVHRL